MLIILLLDIPMAELLASPAEEGTCEDMEDGMEDMDMPRFMLLAMDDAMLGFMLGLIAMFIDRLGVALDIFIDMEV